MQNIFLDGAAGIIGAAVTILFSCFVAAGSEHKEVEFEDD